MSVSTASTLLLSSTVDSSGSGGSPRTRSRAIGGCDASEAFATSNAFSARTSARQRWKFFHVMGSV